MLSRVADAVFWTSRYVERAIAATRLADAMLYLQLDAGALDTRSELWSPRTVGTCIRLARDNARGVRESISTEMWEQLNTLHLWLNEPLTIIQAEEDATLYFRRVREGAQFFQGRYRTLGRARHVATQIPGTANLRNRCGDATTLAG